MFVEVEALAKKFLEISPRLRTFEWQAREWLAVFGIASDLMSTPTHVPLIL